MAASQAFLSPKSLHGYHEAYRSHATTFRTWLLAFAVGMPVFLASNEALWNRFVATDGIRGIALAFLAALGLQAVLALADKYAAWFCYATILGRRNQDSPGTRFGLWWTRNDWPSVLVDLATLGLLACATWMALPKILA